MGVNKNKKYNKNLPNLVPERLREARKARGYTITELAEKAGITHQAISRYEHGKAKPSGEVFSRIINALDFPLSFFMKPVKHKSSCNGVTFFRSLASATKKSREMHSVRQAWLEKELLDYLLDMLEFPAVNLPDINSNKELKNDDIEDLANYVRKYWGLGLGPISNVVLLLEKQGIIISRVDLGECASEATDACSQLRSERPFIFLSAGKNSAARSRFDVIHELGHILLHRTVDESEFNNSKTRKHLEHQSNRFASAFLLPEETFIQEVMSTSLEHFITLKKRWKVSIAAMIKRCEDLELISEHQTLYLWKKMSRLKYRKVEPLDDELEPEQPVMLKQAITMLLNNNCVTEDQLIERISLPAHEIEALCNLEPGTLKPTNNVIPLAKFKK